ncbi:IS3 family transposase [Spirosoma rhododendri]|uniref:IS3 family transposase n=1 Tax=Spirosoma rhododendri TaxID=2728024 RepID=A0A7L5DSQ1_9BACT|nr:IS3 family transposase [Spirosoma rhododendri]QJD81514.1 IS3 family transposase [Spirosoma rhododendri]
MKQSHPHVSLEELCDLFGVTRQAYYEAAVQEKKTSVAHMLVLRLVSDLRRDMPLLGTRKLFYLLQPELEQHQIKMGRDQLFDLLGFHGLLIRRRKRMVKTTDSYHWLKKYPNRIKDIIVDGPEQLWVSDITYIRTVNGFSYLSLVTDAYSRKVVGFSLYPTLEAVGCVLALKMALKNRKRGSGPTLIHHSDRGIQYCSADYIALLEADQIAISMTQSGSPYDNALAERVNGIIKNEFFSQKIHQNHQQAEEEIARAVAHYNQKRPHASVDYLTPESAHLQIGILKKRWKSYRRRPSAKQNEPTESVID